MKFDIELLIIPATLIFIITLTFISICLVGYQEELFDKQDEAVKQSYINRHFDPFSNKVSYSNSNGVCDRDNW